MAGYIYRVGERFRIKEVDEDEDEVQIFTGAVTIDFSINQITSIWLRGPSSSCATGYELKAIEPVR